METTLGILSAALALSLSANLGLLLHIRKAKKTRPKSVELTEFLRDLMHRGMLEVRRVDPESIFLRSPRDVR